MQISIQTPFLIFFFFLIVSVQNFTLNTDIPSIHDRTVYEQNYVIENNFLFSSVEI